MSTAVVQSQEEIDRAQRALNEAIAARQWQAAEDRRRFGAAVARRLDGVPMHATSPSEVALVVLAVLDELGLRGDHS